MVQRCSKAVKEAPKTLQVASKRLSNSARRDNIRLFVCAFFQGFTQMESRSWTDISGSREKESRGSAIPHGSGAWLCPRPGSSVLAHICPFCQM
eukprot:8292603-Pyramimonas_sp.AAC.1